MLMNGGGGSSFTPVQEKTADQHNARAAVADLPAGEALKSASYSANSRKRKHKYSAEQVGRSDNSAGVRQQQRDANEIVDSMFIKTKDNPDRIKATLKRVVEHAASHPRTEAEVGHEGLRILLGSKDRWSTEEEEEAGRCRCGGGRQAADQLSQLFSLLSSGIGPPPDALAPRPRFSLCPCPPSFGKPLHGLRDALALALARCPLPVARCPLFCPLLAPLRSARSRGSRSQYNSQYNSQCSSYIRQKSSMS
jgi:hypothetical protein